MAKQLTQKHHISYEPEEIITLYKGEHWAITILNRRSKNMSKGFLRCLKKYIDEHAEDAVDLDNKVDLDENTTG